MIDYTELCIILDGYAEENTPGGIADDSPAMEATNAAFSFYVNKYGIPTTANAARRLFEFAAALDTTMMILTEMAERSP